MTTEDFITELFCRIDDTMKGLTKHSQANLYPSEIVTLGMLFALKGVGNRAFYRWLVRDYKPLFPKLPERTRLFRLFVTHQNWTERFLADPSLLSVIDSYGIEFEFTQSVKADRSSRFARRVILIGVGLWVASCVSCSTTLVR